jgi:hypothetical protein
MLYKS